MTPNEPLNYNKIVTSIIATISVITFIIYLFALQNGFIRGYDDDLYVYNNENIRTINIDFIRWSLTAVVMSHWHPLTMFTHALDYAVWGLNPWGHHLSNILLHTLNTILVFILVTKVIKIEYAGKFNELNRKLYDRMLIIASVAALLFGIHPLHVESVAWVSERKDVLYAFFYLLSILAYLEYNSRSTQKRRFYYAACSVFFVLSLLSKPMAVSLPIVLLILDYYPLKRLEKCPKKVNIIIIEKLLFYILALLISLTTLWAEYSGKSIAALENTPIIARLFVSAYSFLFYIDKIIMPINLRPFYPYPTHIMVRYYGLAVILLIAITLYSIWLLKKQNRIVFCIWLYYIVSLIPVIGIVQVGKQMVADRYIYLASIGPFILLGIGIGLLFEKYHSKRLTVIFPCLVLLGILIFKTIKQIGIWHDSTTFWLYYYY